MALQRTIARCATGLRDTRAAIDGCRRHRYGRRVEAHDASSIVIRPAKVVDVEGIAAVHATSWRETYGRFVADPETDPWFDVDRRIDMWRANVEQDAFVTVVAEDASGSPRPRRRQSLTPSVQKNSRCSTCSRVLAVTGWDKHY